MGSVGWLAGQVDILYFFYASISDQGELKISYALERELTRNEECQMPTSSVYFFSTTDGWAACEELWSEAALRLVNQGFKVAASVSSPIHPRVYPLQSAGVHVLPRPVQYSLLKRAWHYAFVRVKQKW